jgi:DNA-binding MarR family transcriptional regulator
MSKLDMVQGERPRNGLPAFLIAQLGAYASAQFAKRLEPLGFTPAHAGILRIIAVTPGLSQQELAARLGMYPSRLVAVIDDLEKRSLIERQPSPLRAASDQVRKRAVLSDRSDRAGPWTRSTRCIV